jgi:hypothetical protein
MTTIDLIQRLPRLQEIFPQPIQQEWSAEEVLAARKKQEESTLAGLNKWKAENEND